MPHPCVVCGRSRMNPNNREEEYMFFGFPVNDEARTSKWLEFCCREDLYKLTKKQLLQRMVCSKHFEQKDFLNEYLDRLNCTAVPSIYDPKQSLYNITCVLCGRSRRDPPGLNYDGATFHHFPGEEFRCLKWLDFVGIDSYYRLTRKEILFCYICSKHFDPTQFVPGYKTRLVDNAVPNVRNFGQLDGSEQYIMEFVSEPKSYSAMDKSRKLDPLPSAVLESQACAACGRSRSDPRNKMEKYKFHPFPAYEIGRCLRWCQFLGREDLLKMSPNQIRKLVLCSKHFQTGQSFHKVGPCDAVPTIKDVAQFSIVNTTQQSGGEQRMIEVPNVTHATKKVRKRGSSRPLVSSKKPKVDNKPSPLAKKRGKSKRPTLINIPRPDSTNIENRVVRKLPLPPTPTWKFQFTEQLQPITIANNIASSIANNIQGNIKNMILPFAGDISNFGTPIPVHSLSSIPPGFLIKIDLPEPEQQIPVKVNKIATGIKVMQPSAASNEIDPGQQVWVKNDENAIALPVVNETKEETDKNFDGFLSMSSEEAEDKPTNEELEVREEVVLPHTLKVLDKDEAGAKEDQFYEDFEEVESLSPRQERSARRRQISGTMRRTIFPIRNQVEYFLRKVSPHMHRLPKKARAQIKLAIVNMVIDHL